MASSSAGDLFNYVRWEYSRRAQFIFPDDPMTETSPASQPPLTPVAFEILLCLSTGEKHGYAILREIEDRTDGRLGLHAGSLYRAMARLVDEELLTSAEGPAGEEVDGRRRYYAITARGRRSARAEAERLTRQLEVARSAQLFG